MIFNTWTFGLFAAIAITIYWTVVPERLRPLYLIAVGAVFYAWAIPAYLALIVSLGIVTFVGSRWMMRFAVGSRARRGIMTLAATLVVGALVLFKYLHFFVLTIDEVSRHNILPLPQITVPLAISFFTFEYVHVLYDVYRGKIAHIDPLSFATFAMFFPTMIAGPIKRYQTFAPQIEHLTLPPNPVLALNLYRIALGLFKKVVIADSMTVLAQPLTAPDSAPWARLDYWVAILAYTAKIYFDFSGYSDIAIGLSGVLGVRIPENFDRPYWAQNIADFWRRWHMSLSSWIRDYVFIPLGGSRRSLLLTGVNLFIAMALAGLWHGAAWTFVLWGLWHGAGLATHRLWTVAVVPRVAWFQSASRTLLVASGVATFVFVVVGWVLFAAASLPNALAVIARAF